MGYGVRIPLAGSREGINANTNTVTESELSYDNIKTLFVNDYILYGKLNFDIYYYIGENFALTYGLFLSYSYGMQYYNQNSFYANLNDEKRGFNSLEIGISVGFYFGKQNPKSEK